MHWASILSYMSSSFLIVIFNKMLLSTYNFPSVSFLMFWQSLVCSLFFYYHLPNNNHLPTKMIMLAALINMANIYFGLNASGFINIAMFTALRRISIPMTMVCQWYIFKCKPQRMEVLSVIMIVFGAFIAAMDDFTYNFKGYLFVTINNILTAISQIMTKKAIKSASKESYLFYSSVINMCLSAFGSMNFNTKRDFHEWHNNGFRVAFIGSILLGLMINWSVAWVLQKNDALTLSIAGSTKSSVMGLIVCMGLFDPTYVFSTMNFIGLQVSAAASLLYVWSKREKKPVLPTHKPPS